MNGRSGDALRNIECSGYDAPYNAKGSLKESEDGLKHADDDVDDTVYERSYTRDDRRHDGFRFDDAPSYPSPFIPRRSLAS